MSNIPFHFRCIPSTSSVEKHRLDYILTLWWKDLIGGGFRSGFTCGLVYGLSIQPTYQNHRELREELIFLYKLAMFISGEAAEESIKRAGL